MKKLVELMNKKNLTLSLAESASAGYTSYLITKTPGSSSIFKGGIIVYSLFSKNLFFKIDNSKLTSSQGVSSDIAQILAKKIRAKLKTDVGASIVGFAGPKSPKGRKVGTFYISVASRESSITKKVILKGNRDSLRKQISEYLLELIYSKIEK